MSNDLIRSLLDRYLNGETSAEENERVERWLDENGNPNSPWQQYDQQEKANWLSGIFTGLHEKIQLSKQNVNLHQPQVVLLPNRKYYWRNIAAAAAVIMILFTAYLQWPSSKTTLTPKNLAALTVPAHQKKQITLADGSKIWVNEGSELRYPKEFDGQTREVYLSGEAYFDIRHDASKPFIIHTGKLVTTVLGTAFNIKEDKTLHTIVVTVTRGKVAVANGLKQLGIITPNQQISFNLANERAVQATVDAQQVIAWQENDLYFDDITFAEAAAQLQERFHVKISFSNSKLKNCQFSGIALKGAELDKILKAICAFNQATYQKKTDGTILIEGPGCN